ncbi:ABC transporter ATP-binding protein [Rhodothermus marinus]|uniref:ABC transporter ATP-binding protein n=1 Tax=Rhodothermus marinus TaxID=29549 RepID=UPI001FB2E220|nr:ABC transporter ATP-binding protein [Rhodothermus marinus]
MVSFPMPVIEARALTKVYRTGLLRRTRRALDGLNMSVEAGEIFALVGPNGAGKTTFVKLALGLLFPTSGEVLLNGRPPTEPAARASVGFLPERFSVPGYLKAEQVLRFFGELSGLRGRALQQRIDEVLEWVGLSEERRTPVKAFSRGMLQRLGLAQALLHDPDLLILDEPTGGLDPIARHEFRTLIQRLSEAGKTIFLNTHLIDEVARMAHRVAILNRGRLVRVGTVAELLQDETDLEAVIVRLLNHHADTL